MSHKSSSVTLDNETFQIAEKLAKLSNKSISDMIKDLIKKQWDISDFNITDNVKKISGILKTNDDYKTLRDMYIAEKAEKYESID